MSELQLNPTSADPAMLGASLHVRKERDFYPTIDAGVTRAIARFLLAEEFADQTRHSVGARLW
jgi:hypothetical protein